MRSESDISIQFDHFVEQQQTASDLSPSDSDSNNEVEDIFVIIADLKEDVAKYENQYKSSRVKGFKDSEYQEYLVRNLNKGRGKVSFSSEGRF